MDRVIRDGKVAVIFSGVGGWYSYDFCFIKELLFDPKLVNIILHPNFEDDKVDEELDKMVEEYIEDVNNRNYESGSCEGLIFKIFDKKRIYNLEVCWVPLGKRFTVENHEDCERIKVEEDFEWLEA